MSEFDPIQYGRMLEAVESLQRQVSEMEKTMKSLLELANKSKGGLWMGMTLSSLFGGLATWFATHFFGSTKP